MPKSVKNKVYNPGPKATEHNLRGHQKTIVETILEYPGITRADLVEELNKVMETKMASGPSGLITYYEKKLVQSEMIEVDQAEEEVEEVEEVEAA